MEDFYDVLHAAIVGDALSIQYESNTLTCGTRTTHMSINPSGFERHWTHYGVIRFCGGQVSDYTEIMLALLRSLRNRAHDSASTPCYDRDAAVSAYIDWCSTKCPFMKRSMRKHFSNITTIEGYYSRLDCMKMERERARTLSNEALLRSIPLVMIGFLRDKTQMLQAVASDCALTHPQPECILANQCFIQLLYELMRCSSPSRANRRGLIEMAFSPVYSSDSRLLISAYDNALNQSQYIITGSDPTLYTHSIYCALYCLMHFDSITEAYDWTISNYGGSSAIAVGAVMAATVRDVRCDATYMSNLHAVMSQKPYHRDYARPFEYDPLSVFDAQ